MALIQNRYPIDYRAEVLRPVMSALKHGDSVGLVGLAGVGKSNLVHFMEQPEVRLHYWPEEDPPRTHFALVPCRADDLPKDELFGAMRISAWSIAIRAKLEIADPALPGVTQYQMLHDFLRVFYEEHGQRLVYVFDEFERLIQSQPAGFFDDLRALRDDHRAAGPLAFVTITHRMPQLVTGRSPFGQTGFFELLRDHIYPLPPHQPIDAQGMLQTLLQKEDGVALTPEACQRLIVVSGGHCGILRATFLALKPDFSMSVRTLLHFAAGNQRIREACDHIWVHLHAEEQEALRRLVRDQPVSAEMTGFLVRRGLLRDKPPPAIFSPLFREYVARNANA